MDVKPFKNISRLEDLRELAQKLTKNMDKKESYEIEKFFQKKPSTKCIDFLHNALIVDIDKRKSAK